jgi:hypothetical protein
MQDLKNTRQFALLACREMIKAGHGNEVMYEGKLIIFSVSNLRG